MRICMCKNQKINNMRPLQFYNIVIEMREWQKNYNKTHSVTALQRARRLENIIDNEIDRVNKIIQDKRNNKQLTIF